MILCQQHFSAFSRLLSRILSSQDYLSFGWLCLQAKWDMHVVDLLIECFTQKLRLFLSLCEKIAAKEQHKWQIYNGDGDIVSKCESAKLLT